MVSHFKLNFFNEQHHFYIFSQFLRFVMSLSTDQSDPERVEYHEWLLRIQDQQLREELLDIVSKTPLFSPNSLPFGKLVNFKIFLDEQYISLST